MFNNNMKTLRISDETHRELTKIGSYEETMDDIIKKLLRHWKESTVQKQPP
jgi:predicted CopG family antitoxin